MPVGVDCGGRKIAVVCPELGVYATYEVKKIDYQKFYRQSLVWLVMYAKVLQGEKWFMEAPVVAGARNIQSTIRVAQTTGIVHSVVPDVQEVAVSSWKKATVGNGNASKDMVRDWLQSNHPDEALRCRGNQDLYDAACIALYGGLLRE